MALKTLRDMELDRASRPFQMLEGTLQRVHYQKKELTLIAQGQIWHFAVDRDCQFWFDGQAVILRCFHPLDKVQVEFIPGEPRHSLKGIRGWEK